MERRADPGSGLDSNLDNSVREQSKAWQAVRRALGRLVSRVGVREVGDDERTIAPEIRPGELTLPPPRLPLADWQPSAAVRSAPVPSAGTGLRESDLMPSVTLAAGDYALAAPGIYAMPAAGVDAARTEGIPLEWPAAVIRLPDAFLRLPAAPVQVSAAALLPAPQSARLKTMPLKGWGMEAPPVRALRLPRIPDPRVRWGGDSVLRRMPITRRGRPPEDSAAGQRRLAETVQAGPDDVTLLGVYPNIPILAVERMVVEEEGRRLRLWLKPEVLRGRAASHRITLLVGRQISTGKMLQAAL